MRTARWKTCRWCRYQLLQPIYTSKKSAKSLTTVRQRAISVDSATSSLLIALPPTLGCRPFVISIPILPWDRASFLRTCDLAKFYGVAKIPSILIWKRGSVLSQTSGLKEKNLEPLHQPIRLTKRQTICWDWSKRQVYNRSLTRIRKVGTVTNLPSANVMACKVPLTRKLPIKADWPTSLKWIKAARCSKECRRSDQVWA